MTAVQHSIRLSAPLDKALRTLATQQKTTVYAMLQRSVKTGIAAQANPLGRDSNDKELLVEVASVSTRLAEVERTIDRALFTACAAYCYARSAAMGGGKTDEIIAAEINRAYERQRGIAQEAQS